VTDVLTPAAARRVLLLLSVTRWFPVGLVVGVITLWFLERGLTIAEALLAFSLQGILVFLLELPTSGFADAFGRRPLLLAAAMVNLVASVVIVMANSFWTFVLAGALQGVFRALDSGPLEAWYVDTVHATEPGADVDRPLSAQGTVVGIAMAVGSLISGGLIVWNPLSGQSALLLPLLCWAGLNVVHLIAVAILMKEPAGDAAGSSLARAAASTREAPVVIREGLGMLRHNRVLLALVLVEFFWATGLVVFEIFQPIRLAELVGGEERAGALMGPVAAIALGFVVPFMFGLGLAFAALWGAGYFLGRKIERERAATSPSTSVTVTHTLLCRAATSHRAATEPWK